MSILPKTGKNELCDIFVIFHEFTVNPHTFSSSKITHEKMERMRLGRNNGGKIREITKDGIKKVKSERVLRIKSIMTEKL